MPDVTVKSIPIKKYVLIWDSFFLERKLLTVSTKVLSFSGAKISDRIAVNIIAAKILTNTGKNFILCIFTTWNGYTIYFLNKQPYRQ